MAARNLDFNADLAQRFIAGNDRQEGLPAFLGIRIASFEPGRLVCEMPVTDQLVTMIGNMHGGCISGLVDHCLGVVMYPHMEKGAWAATTEFKINLLAPVSTGVCTATAEIVSMTKKTAVVRIDVENEGRLAAIAQGTCLIQPPRPKPES